LEYITFGFADVSYAAGNYLLTYSLTTTDCLRFQDIKWSISQLLLLPYCIHHHHESAAHFPVYSLSLNF